MQIIAGALIMGTVIYLAIVVFIVLLQTDGRGLGAAGDLPMLSLGAAVLLGVQAPLAFLLPNIQTRTALRRIASGTWQLPPGANPEDFRSDASKLLAVRQTTMLVGLAILEGAAFLGCTAYLLEAQSFVLGVILAALVLMLVSFPTESRVRVWLERQADQLAELRLQGDATAER